MEDYMHKMVIEIDGWEEGRYIARCDWNNNVFIYFATNPNQWIECTINSDGSRSRKPYKETDLFCPIWVKYNPPKLYKHTFKVNGEYYEVKTTRTWYEYTDNMFPHYKIEAVKIDEEV
jgi:hypothetical protein